MSAQRPTAAGASPAACQIDTERHNVIALRPKLGGGIQPARQPSPFDKLTVTLILEQHRRGELEEGVLLALLQAATGLRP
jgi:hypothetical protein